MKYAKYIAVISSLILAALPASADVSLSIAPVSLVTSPISVKASSSQIALFSFAATETDNEELTSVTVTVNNSDASTVSGSDLDAVAIYKDDGDGNFETNGDDLLVGSQSTVAIGSATLVLAENHQELDGNKFFVTLTTDASWSTGDKVTVTLETDGIITSADSPTFATDLTTAVISADTTGPSIQSAVASKNGSDQKQVVITFNEATNKASVTESNIESVLDLNNSHTWLDGEGDITSAAWNSAGTVLTIVLDDEDPDPSVAVGDTVTVSGSTIKDSAGNSATGNKTITGDFTKTEDDQDNEDDDEDSETGSCSNGLKNGRIYKVTGDENTTVYLAAACILKPFRGAAAFHARGHKFHDIIILDSLTGYTVSDKPALPAGGTLVKGSDATVWIVTKNGKRKGFVSANAFVRLGFDFHHVDQISDSDLSTMETDTPVTENDEHPDGTVAKCGNSSTVFEIHDHMKFPFTSASAFELHGHSFEHIAVIDCGRFAYVNGQNVTQ